MREERGERRGERREERREKREERREKREERRDPKRGRQISPNEAARGLQKGPERPLGLVAPRQRAREGW